MKSETKRAIDLLLRWGYRAIVGSKTRPSRDLEDCLDLAIRKGKAGGEPKPTER